MPDSNNVHDIRQQLGDLIGKHGAGDVFHALDMLCLEHARQFTDRKPHVPATWIGWSGMFAGMAIQARVLADPWASQ